MKLKLALPKKISALSLMSLVIMVFMTFNTVGAQADSSNNERTVTGLIVNEDGPLPGVNITLEGTRIGAVTNEDGKFTFPKKLKTGNTLIFSYLGYETQKMKIAANTTFIKLELTTDMIEMIGALDTAKPYKSKRKKN
ncbi:carboxypeptidase-like regulatory domain-containing protein [Winogradskyella sp. PE311]|uniref:carboxypeptidase-like regulatory domain-containing protein n=1 Tax=Winogradskyella sp. PE311 TaxID=3366943 RepID=UPI003980EB9A